MVEAKPNFFLSVRALSRLFRRLFLGGPQAAFGRAELRFFGALAPLAERSAFAERVCSLKQGEWVVYAKPPFGGAARVLAYLARYTHRTAIANSRLLAIADNEVACVYKDYRRGGRRRIMRLGRHEFIPRYLLRVLPNGYHRVRHYGFLAKGDRDDKPSTFALLAASAPDHPNATPPASETTTTDDGSTCPDPGGRMRRIGPVAPVPSQTFRCDRARPDAPHIARASFHRRRPDRKTVTRRGLSSPAALRIFAPPKPLHDDVATGAASAAGNLTGFRCLAANLHHIRQPGRTARLISPRFVQSGLCELAIRDAATRVPATSHNPPIPRV